MGHFAASILRIRVHRGRARRIFGSLVAASALLAGCGDDTLLSGGAGGEAGSGQGGSPHGEGGNGGEGIGGEPSTPFCGDGAFAPGELCDDGNSVAGDGCSEECRVESGFVCNGSPSICETVCGDGFVAGSEECDDDGTMSGDGCNATCGLEPGWFCDDSEPSYCAAVCGDGIVAHGSPAAGAEACDDGNVALGDGCDGSCNIEVGWSCDLEPSVCTTGCGDGAIAGAEACDDGNLASADGCSTACAIEPGFGCGGEPSLCEPVGVSCVAPIIVTDGFVFAGSDLAAYGDDLDFGAWPGCTNVSGVPNTSPDLVFSVELEAEEHLYVRNLGTVQLVFQVVDTCAPQACLATFSGAGETGFDFTAPGSGTYTVVVETLVAGADVDPAETFDLRFNIAACGNGNVEYLETCDDANNLDGDGCTMQCSFEPGFLCLGTAPTVCYAGTCADPIPASLLVDGDLPGTFAEYGSDPDFSQGPGCASPADSAATDDIVVSVDLLAGERLHTKNFHSYAHHFNLYSHIIMPDQCGPSGACEASAYSDCAGGCWDAEATYIAPQDETVFVVFEAEHNDSPGYYPNPPVNTLILTTYCGNGVLEEGEACDDGNRSSADGCSSDCVVEAGFSCGGEPSACETCDLGPAIDVTMFPYQLTGLTADYAHEQNGVGPGCPAGYGLGEMLFHVDLQPGQTVRMTSSGAAGAILEPNFCDGTSGCVVGGGTTVHHTATAAESIYLRALAGSDSFDLQIEVFECGDGTVNFNETCDDGNVVDGDGCSAQCSIEPGFNCHEPNRPVWRAAPTRTSSRSTRHRSSSPAS
ncbi:MAG: DUF4215 domain-containing protein [Polyangiaceae bacterium]